MQRTCRRRADAARKYGALVAEEIEPQRRVVRIGDVEVGIVVGPGLTRVTAGACAREDLPPAVRPNPRRTPDLAARATPRAKRRARRADRPAARLEGNRQDSQAIFDGAKARAVTPALADVQRRLPIIALLRIERPQVRHVVEPALLGA